MRKLDYYINVSQLGGLADIIRDERERMVRLLRKHTKVEAQHLGGRCSWIPYPDGRYLCQHLQLEDKLLPLLSYALNRGGKPNDSLNYLEPEFLKFQAGATRASIRKKYLWVN